MTGFKNFSNFKAPNMVTAKMVDMKLPTLDIEAMEENRERLAGRLDAADIFKHLVNRMKKFQESLEANEEVGLQLANYGRAAELHIRSIAYQNPNIIEFSGLDLDKNEVVLVQHISQLNFLLVALKPVEEKPYRIGFTA